MKSKSLFLGSCLAVFCGLLLLGFNLPAADIIRVFLYGDVNNNAGSLTNVPHILFEAGSVSNSSVSVSPAANTWFPVTNSLVFGNVTSSGWTVATNSLIYTNTKAAMVHSALTLNLVKTSGGPGTIFVKIYQNGSPINTSMQRQFVANNTDTASTALHPTFMATSGSVFQLWALTTAADNVLVQDMNWVTFSVK